MKVVLIAVVLSLSCLCVAAQETTVEKRVALNERAVALDGNGSPALEATLKTTAINGAEDSPVSNISLVVKNISGTPYTFLTGLVTFYDGAGIRCGEGLFKAGALAADEAFETDSPGIRIRCSPASWRIFAQTLIPRIAPFITQPQAVNTRMNLVISVNGEEHPIQLDKPMVLKIGDQERTIVLREAP